MDPPDGNPRRYGGGYDPIYVAISNMYSYCPSIAGQLEDMYFANEIYFVNNLTCQGVSYLMCTYSDNTFGVDNNAYDVNSEAGIQQMADDRMHEAGHAIGGLFDGPGPCGNMYDCLHHNSFEDATCPMP